MSEGDPHFKRRYYGEMDYPGMNFSIADASAAMSGLPTLPPPVPMPLGMQQMPPPQPPPPMMMPNPGMPAPAQKGKRKARDDGEVQTTKKLKKPKKPVIVAPASMPALADADKAALERYYRDVYLAQQASGKRRLYITPKVLDVVLAFVKSVNPNTQLPAETARLWLLWRRAQES